MSYRDAIIDLLTSNNTKYHLTLTFNKFTPESTCIDCLNTLFKYLNRAIFRGRYSAGQSFLNGFVVQEYTHAMETYHFHILIANSPYLPSYKRFEQFLTKRLKYLKRYSSKHHITHHLLQEYFNDGSNRLETYLTKQFELFGRKATNRIGWLSESKIYFGDLL